MTDRADLEAMIRHLVTAIRADGIDLFIVPAAQITGIEGTAHVSASGGRSITVYHTDRDVHLALVLAHEWGHHRLGHLRQICQPKWQIELAADTFALDTVDPWLDSATIMALRHDVRDRIRPMLQAYLDAGIWTHGEIPTGRAIGCIIPDELRDIDPEA